MLENMKIINGFLSLWTRARLIMAIFGVVCIGVIMLDIDATYQWLGALGVILCSIIILSWLIDTIAATIIRSKR